jgi:hypothetical protein
LGLISIVEFLWLHYIPSLADGTMERKVYTSEVDEMPAPFNLVLNVFLKLVFGPYGNEDIVFNRYVEMKNMC